jgi:hypothetical protein
MPGNTVADPRLDRYTGDGIKPAKQAYTSVGGLAAVYHLGREGGTCKGDRPFACLVFGWP